MDLMEALEKAMEPKDWDQLDHTDVYHVPCIGWSVEKEVCLRCTADRLTSWTPLKCCEHIERYVLHALHQTCGCLCTRYPFQAEPIVSRIHHPTAHVLDLHSVIQERVGQQFSVKFLMVRRSVKDKISDTTDLVPTKTMRWIFDEQEEITAWRSGTVRWSGGKISAHWRMLAVRGRFLGSLSIRIRR